jgi:hypothetical protein
MLQRAFGCQREIFVKSPIFEQKNFIFSFDLCDAKFTEKLVVIAAITQLQLAKGKRFFRTRSRTMIKGDAQVLEPARNVPAMQLGKNLETNFSTGEKVIETTIVEKITERLDVKTNFARLKKRMRSRSSNIL